MCKDGNVCRYRRVVWMMMEKWEYVVENGWKDGLGGGGILTHGNIEIWWNYKLCELSKFSFV